MPQEFLGQPRILRVLAPAAETAQEPRTAHNNAIHNTDTTNGTAARSRLNPNDVTARSEFPASACTVVEIEALATTERPHTINAAVSARNRTKKCASTDSFWGLRYRRGVAWSTATVQASVGRAAIPTNTYQVQPARSTNSSTMISNAQKPVHAQPACSGFRTSQAGSRCGSGTAGAVEGRETGFPTLLFRAQQQPDRRRPGRPAGPLRWRPAGLVPL